MKFLISIIFFLLTFNLNASEYKLEKVISGLNKPWGMSFINDNELFLTQKSGEILKINLTTKEVKNFSHNLKVVQPHWQAGMLDIIYKDEEVFVSYTEDRGNDKTSTSIARGIIKDESFSEIENIFQSDSSWNNIHWGSRLMFKDDLLYASIGERGHGSAKLVPGCGAAAGSAQGRRWGRQDAGPCRVSRGGAGVFAGDARHGGLYVDTGRLGLAVSAESECFAAD